VRMRVATEPAPERGLKPWRLAAAAAVVVVAVTSVSLWNRDSDLPARRPAPATAVREIATAPAAGLALVRGTERAARRVRAVRRVDSLPLPLISPEDAGSVRLLVASAQQGITTELLPPADGRDRPIEVAALQVPLLGAERPIEINAVDSGERE
jgi:hypothetical protein